MRLNLSKVCVAAVPLGLAAVVGWAAWGSDLPSSPPHFRMAVSEAIIGAAVNEGDATLAIQAWRDALAKETNVQIDVHVADKATLAREIREHQVDAFTMTTLEFFGFENYAAQRMITDDVNSKGGDEYVLLVHADSGIRDLAGLRHKSLGLYDNPQMCLAPMWLETLLASSNLGAPQEFLSRISLLNKLSRIVLPVYFRQSDACLVTRRDFATMCELNPQLGHKLRVLAASPKLIPKVMAFHKDCPPDRVRKFESVLVGLNKTAAGQQALTLFQSSRLVVVDSSLLQSALDLVKTHNRLVKASARK
jgi:phosphonate transport system substrate-binding protein